MAGKDSLRIQREGTVINNTSEKREGKASQALQKVTLEIKNQGTNDVWTKEGKK